MHQKTKKSITQLSTDDFFLSEVERLAHLGFFQFEWPIGEAKFSGGSCKIFEMKSDFDSQSTEKFIEIIHPNDTKKFSQAIEDSIKKNEKFEIEFRIITPKKNLKFLHGMGHLVLNPFGKPKVFGTIMDVTQWKKSERLLLEAQEINHLGSWEWDMIKDEVILSDEFYRILGQTPNKEKLTIKSIAGFIQNEDKPKAIKELYKAIEDHTDWHVENRLVRNDGTYRHVISRGKAYYDQENKPFSMVGTILDITERKEMENALIDEKGKTQMILDTSASFILIVGKDQKVLLVNKKGCNILGLQESEIIGKNWITNFIPKDQHKVVREAFDQLMRGEIKQVEFFENSIITSAGKKRWMEWHNTIIKDKEGKTIGSLSSGLDITERKKVERIRMDAVVEGEERERQRVARELHDGLMQVLSAISLNLKALEAEVGNLHRTKRDAYENALQLVENAISDTRDISHRMMPRDLERFGFIDAVINLCENINQSSSIVINFDFSGRRKKIEKRIEVMLFRILQELINNILKHSKADLAQIEFHQKKNQILLNIKDNGIGFEVTKNEHNSNGIGLQNIATRIKAFNGTLSIDAIKGKGTSINIKIPIE